MSAGWEPGCWIYRARGEFIVFTVLDKPPYTWTARMSKETGVGYASGEIVRDIIVLESNDARDKNDNPRISSTCRLATESKPFPEKAAAYLRLTGELPKSWSKES